MASGDVVNTAARLQAAAPVERHPRRRGDVSRDARTRSTTARRRPSRRRARPSRCAVWEALERAVALRRRRRRAAASPLVGRERELDLLVDALARCRREPLRQLVTLVGVPGIGKSRLVVELFAGRRRATGAHLLAAGPLAALRRGRHFWALGEIVKAQAGILETDDAAQAEAKLARRSPSCRRTRTSARWVERTCARSSGVGGEPTSAGDRRSEAFAAWRRFLEALAEQRPLVLVFEDLHWADDGLLDFVDHLVDWATACRCSSSCTARPELLDRRPGWGGGKRNATTLSLAPLADDETARLLGSLLDQLRAARRARRRAARAAGGNPLYAEEYVRMLRPRLLVATSGGARSDELPLPETVQGIIAARLDAPRRPTRRSCSRTPRWSARSSGSARSRGRRRRRAAGRASCCTRSSARSSSAASGARRSRGETEYAFLHVLVRDVAYGQIPRAAAPRSTGAPPSGSSRSHRTAARTTPRCSRTTTARRSRSAEAAAARPSRCVGRPGGARRRVRARRGAERLGRARKSLPGSARAHVHGGPAAAAPASCASRARSRSGRARRRPRARPATASSRTARSTRARARRSSRGCRGGVATARPRGHSARALELVRDLPLSVPKLACVRPGGAPGSTRRRDGDRRSTLACKTFALAEALGHDELASHALNTLGMARMRAGEIEGLADLERSVELADRSNAPDEIIKSRNNLANWYWVVGRLDDATTQWAAARDAALALGQRPGPALAGRGDDRGPRLPRRARRGGRTCGRADREDGRRRPGQQRGAPLPREGVRDARTRRRGARRVGGGARRSARGRRPQHLAPALAFRAFILFAAGHDGEANAIANELLGDSLLRPYMQQIPDLPLLLAEHGRGADYAAAAGHLPRFGLWQDAATAAAAGEFARAAVVYGAIGAPFHEAWAQLLAAENGENADLESARAFFARQGATLYLRRCEALLPASA